MYFSFLFLFTKISVLITHGIFCCDVTFDETVIARLVLSFVDSKCVTWFFES